MEAQKAEDAEDFATFVIGNTVFTLYHELGHFLGFEEGDMERMGLE